MPIIKDTERRWSVAQPAPETFFRQFSAYPRPVAQLFYNRHLRTPEQVEQFLQPAYAAELHDPFALEGVRHAAEIIHASLAAGEPIVIHGDYDADGLTAAAVLYDVLSQLGARVSVFIPSRYEEGYGVAPETLQRLSRNGTKLVITVDCGISDGPAIAAARQTGLKVIVTDHHVPPNAPPVADAVINPNLPGQSYPNRALTGAGVAFKLAQGILAHSQLGPRETERFEKWLLDLVAIGTVADMAELQGENRALVKFGLAVLARTRRPGLQELLKTAGVTAESLTSETIGYAIAPRLNAPGRISHARTALDLLLAQDSATAAELAAALEQSNQERQQLTLSAVSEVRDRLDLLGADDPLIFLDGDWKSGIVGLIAGRLVREYARPAVVVERGTSVSRGSVRSLPGFHVAEALQAHGALLASHGGHAQAGGFTVETRQLEHFREKLTAFARTQAAMDSTPPETTAEAELSAADLSFEFIEHVNGLEPFGIGNPRPEFLIRQARIERVTTVGRDQSHLKLSLIPADGPRTAAIGFGLGHRAEQLAPGTRADVIGRPVVNQFNGSRTVEWYVTDIRTA